MLDQGKIYSIKDVTNVIKNLIENNHLLSDIWIRGEISNFTHHSSGHMYFTLKDESSKMRAIMFASNNRALKFIPKNGMKVITRGYISLFERDGQYQFYSQEMQPDGVGQLYLAYEQLKEKLEKEGYFDPKYKKTLPPFPKKIGIITSTTGAAVRDMITTIKRRYPLVEVMIFPVLVQGEFAAKSIAFGIEQMNKLPDLDVLIIGRGGGSIEELWAFNEEIVAKSIHESVIPVISAVGHETDFTISDFVADVRAATPTAAAEIAVPHIDELKVNIAFLKKRLQKAMKKQLENEKLNLSAVLKSAVFKRPKQHLQENAQRLDRLEDRLKHSLHKHISHHKQRLSIILQELAKERPNQKVINIREKLHFLNKQLIREVYRIKDYNRQQLAYKIGQLDALSPLKVMQRGFAIPYTEGEKNVIKSIEQVQLGDIIKLHLVDGKLDCQVWGLEDKKNEGI